MYSILKNDTFIAMKRTKSCYIKMFPHNYSTIMIVPYVYINICLYVPCLLHNRWVNLNA